MNAQGVMLMGMPVNRVAVPLLVLLILAMMVLPLPTFMLDVLFTLNIALAMIVLLVSLNARRPLDFSVFPTVLLLTTLLRLSLNVASTRIILMQGHTGPDAAGKVIESFGNFLVGGNIAVGFVVFLILVIINFVVITKGAGRIAEVAARFTLDSMPGKQLAVDADLNAGFVDESEARMRRAEIGREADFYGAMDGASKFVRGDAIAGMIILLVNLIGGIAVGLLQHDLGVGEALARYALLTVGDGLVTQIPALIISTAAGIVVSRASSEQDLSREFSTQIFGRPQTLYVAAAVLAALGVIPGTPHVAFLTIAAVLAALALWLTRHRESAAFDSTPLPPIEEEALPVDVTWDDIPPVDVLALEVGYRLIPLVDRNQGGAALTRITESRRRFATDMGLVVPLIRVRDNLDLKPNTFRITLKGVDVAHGEMPTGQILAVDTGDVLGRIDGTPGVDPLMHLPGVWIDAARVEEAELRGFVVLEPAELIARQVEAVFRQHAPELLGRTEVQQLLDALARSHPGLVEDVTPRHLPLTTVQAILQQLIAENVPIRDTRTLFETLAARAPKTQDIDDLVETVRAALGRSIVDRLFEGSDTLLVIGLAPTTESRLLYEMGDEGEALLAPSTLDALNGAAEQAVAEHEAGGHPPVLLTSPGLRAILSRLLRRTLPRLAVIAYAEVPADKTVQVNVELSIGETP
ncbi:flagellar biosynthesis protein FlhA [Thiobacillus denitrificans ATCC 25259]|uniref:Flagellar biosynthesis protein FlhA n=1 Tax=Thiobacillus denitrificans (strain ATCC 25259 / T1) TaxID=292415 RepID=Q3SJM4_THIDA|nr:flagellar biosynthesis protein FlhA [Thiobacillus denitrificans]AAZ97130.1 flagellar biosynthesis protein FlhA [Thiobacillus denitrificans ATCC 25259]